MTSTRLRALILLVALSSVSAAAQKPVKEETMWIDGTKAPASVWDMVGNADIVVVAVYTGDKRLHPDLRPASPVSSLHKFEIIEVIKSAASPLKVGGSIEVDMPGGVIETATETRVTRAHGQEPLIPKRRYVLFLKYLAWRSPATYVPAWGDPGQGVYDATGNTVRPLSTTRREQRGTSTEGFLAELRKFK